MAEGVASLSLLAEALVDGSLILRLLGTDSETCAEIWLAEDMHSL